MPVSAIPKPRVGRPYRIDRDGGFSAFLRRNCNQCARYVDEDTGERCPIKDGDDTLRFMKWRVVDRGPPVCLDFHPEGVPFMEEPPYRCPVTPDLFVRQ